jgi:hypothetical protein
MRSAGRNLALLQTEGDGEIPELTVQTALLVARGVVHALSDLLRQDQPRGGATYRFFTALIVSASAALRAASRARSTEASGTSMTVPPMPSTRFAAVTSASFPRAARV